MATIHHEASNEINRHLSQSLGDAVVRIWGLLPVEVQQQLFEEASTHHSETRSQLALFLHGKHPRTCASLKANAMIEPDSLGG